MTDEELQVFAADVFTLQGNLACRRPDFAYAGGWEPTSPDVDGWMTIADVRWILGNTTYNDKVAQFNIIVLLIFCAVLKEGTDKPLTIVRTPHLHVLSIVGALCLVKHYIVMVSNPAKACILLWEETLGAALTRHGDERQ